MHETADDIAALQRLLDDSYARAGEHLLRIHTPERRVDAARLVEVLRGVRVVSIATVTARGEPRVGPVDGLFYRGAFWFGSASDSVRFRLLRRNSAVSGAHTVGDTFAVVVHGRAVELAVFAPEHEGFRRYLVEVYPDWEEWHDDTPATYARIDAHAMFAYAFEGEKTLAAL